MSRITTAFGVPMVISQLDGCEEINRELRDLFVECEGQGRKFANPEPLVTRNEPLFESKFTLFEWPQRCVKKIRDHCYAVLYNAIRELNGYSLDELKKLHISTESWFHVTRRGGYFATHSHPLHSWSGVYCVRHDGDDPASDSGRLVFHDPHAHGWSYVDMAVARMAPPFNIGGMKLRLVPGQLILFPSWLLHEVLPYEGDTERITIAFNAKFHMSSVRNQHHL